MSLLLLFQSFPNLRESIFGVLRTWARDGEGRLG